MKRKTLGSMIESGEVKVVSAAEAVDIIREANGGTLEGVRIITPQFDRPPNWPAPGAPPKTREEWEALRVMPKASLLELGLYSYDGRLMLFPGTWFRSILEGMRVENIFGEEEIFSQEDGDPDTRYGYLAYGVPAIDGVSEEEMN